MIQPTLSRDLGDLEAPANVNRTSDYAITPDARNVYAAVMIDTLDRADDMLIALEIRLRPLDQTAERTELADFIREQGYDPAEFAA